MTSSTGGRAKVDRSWWPRPPRRAARQAGYIDSIAAGAPTLPAVKAVVYFDVPGPLRTWQFTPAGLEAFGRLAADSYFHPQ